MHPHERPPAAAEPRSGTTRSLAGTFDLVSPHLPAALVDDHARARVRTMAATLPAALSHCLYVECRPGNPRLADLIVDVDAAGREILAGANPVLALGPEHAGAAWQGIAAVMQAWNEEGSSLHHAMDGAWVEFDLHGGGAPPIAPSLFVDFSDGVQHAATWAVRTAALHEVAHLLGHASSAQAAKVDAAVSSLPAHAVLLYAGFMLPRGGDAVRLCVMGLARPELVTWLRRVGWPGDVDALAAIMTLLARPDGGAQPQPAILHVDIGAEVGGGIGVEYPFARRPQLSGVIAERGVLDTLVAAGLVTATDRDAVARWAGAERRTMPHELWPSLLVRRLNHVKLVLDDGGLRAKLYLCAEHVPAPRTAE